MSTLDCTLSCWNMTMSFRYIEMKLRNLFDCSLKVKKALHSQHGTTSTVDGKGVKVPKLEVSTFNGDILGWKTFWEQFPVSIHTRPNLSNAEKLV